MKKISAAFLLILSLVAVMAVAVSADTPIEISSATELMSVDMDKSYKLMADIDLTGVEFTPIGTAEAPFTGTFDGNSKKISGLTFDTEGKYIGLFGACTDATVKNLTVDALDVNIEDSQLNEIFVSGICAYAVGNCTFENIEVNGSISVKGKGDVHAAGICAYAECVGGPISYFTSCINNASITAKSTGTSSEVRAAGIVAYGLFADVILSANHGEITVDAKCGAIAAGISAAYGQRDIKKTYNTAKVSATSETTGATAGGLVASSIYAIIEDSYNSGDIHADGGDVSTAGGICAESQFGNEYKRCYNAGAVTIDGDGYAGSLAGTASNRDSFSSNYVIESTAAVIAKNPKDGAATSLTQTQMKSADSFAGFDFDTVWYMPDSGDYLYPMLRGFEVEEAEAVPGDLDADGSINSLDYIIAARHIAAFVGYEDYVSVENCDLNLDGNVTSVDAVILARHIADWTGYETIPLSE